MRHVRRLAGITALALAGVGALVPLGTAPPAEAAARPDNFVANSTFDASCDGWYNSGYGDLTLVTGGGKTGNACRLSNGGGRTAVLNDLPNSITSTVAGVSYRFSARVRASQAGIQVQMRQMEYTYANVLQGQASEIVTLNDATWQTVTVLYTAATSGSAIDANLMALNLPTGTYLDIDEVTFTPETNLTVNPSFDADTSGWNANQGAIASVADGRGGTRGGKVSNPAGGGANLNDAVNTVTSTVAGTTYLATAWVKASQAGMTLNLRQMEWGTAKVGESITTVTLPDAAWHPIQALYTTVSTGAQIDLNVYATVGASTYFVVDDVTLSVFDNKTLNSTFSAGTWGWFNSGGATGTLAPLAAGRTGAGARITATGGNIAYNDTVNSVQSTTQGTAYTATAWVKTSASRSVAIRLMEYTRANTLMGSNQTTLTVAPGIWTQMSVTYTAASTDATLDLNVYSLSAPAGFTLDLDDITLYAGTTPPDPYTGWHQIWADEFNTSTVDTTKWKILDKSNFGLGTPGNGDGSQACLYAGNLSISNSVLTITGNRETTTCNGTTLPYTSGHIHTQGIFKFMYGRVEMRAKTPLVYGASKGLWPALAPVKQVEPGVGFRSYIRRCGI